MPLPRVPLMQGSSQKWRAARATLRVPAAPQYPARPAARSAPQRRGQRVQRLGMANDLDIVHKVPFKRFTDSVWKQYTIFSVRRVILDTEKLVSHF